MDQFTRDDLKRLVESSGEPTVSIYMPTHRAGHDVRENAESIYARLDDGAMPCDGRWPEEDIKTFRRWVDQGMER